MTPNISILFFTRLDPPPLNPHSTIQDRQICDQSADWGTTHYITLMSVCDWSTTSINNKSLKCLKEIWCQKGKWKCC